VVLVVLIAVVGIAAVVGVWYLNYRARQRRIAALFSVANGLGFAFSATDEQGTLGLPFALFRRGDGRGVENVMWGEREQVPMRLFDFWFYEQQSDSRGNRSRTYHRFTCAALTIDADCPTLRIGHEGFLSRMGNALGFKDVELEYDDFNRAFRVKCDDQKFAFSLLDGRMMEWLLEHRGIETIEVVGPFVLLASSKLPPESWLALAGTSEAFHAHIPRVVWSTWPRAQA
jgi:Protein of unknown function (DUF3137)